MPWKNQSSRSWALESIGVVAAVLGLIYALSPVPHYTPPDNTWDPGAMPLAAGLKNLNFTVGEQPGDDLQVSGNLSRDIATIQFSSKYSDLAQSLGWDTSPHQITRGQYLILLNNIQASLEKKP
jgi:hypothetical protein